jgi:hypothetical protein
LYRPVPFVYNNVVPLLTANCFRFQLPVNKYEIK